jgi:hypothetical protein
MDRIAKCACGRLEVCVRGEPEHVMACHCDFCLKRTGGAYPLAAWFGRDQVLTIDGDTNVYNGLEIDGVGAAGGDFGISYHFCSTCGSTVYWTFDDNPDLYVIAVGNFADPDFPAPTDHFFPELRPTWLVPYQTSS